MSDITKTASLTVSKGGAAIATGSLSDARSMTGNDVYSATQNVGTGAAEQITYGDVDSLPGQLLIENQDTVNYIDVTVGTIRIRAGDIAMFQPLETVAAQANTDTVRVQIHACDS